MNEVDALAVLQGKVLCEDCFWFAKNIVNDDTIKQRIEKQLKMEKLTQVPKYHLGKCIKRISLSRGIFFCSIEDKIPPEFPSQIKWRKCIWFIPFSTVMSQGGGVEAGLLWPIK
jgi:hypothetical protein